MLFRVEPTQASKYKDDRSEEKAIKFGGEVISETSFLADRGKDE